MPSHTSAMRQLAKTGLVLLFVALAGCAQNQATSTADTRESTLTDAQAKARGRHARAPSQLQLGFGGTAPDATAQAAGTEPAQAAGSAVSQPISIRPLREVKTFLGTLPCTQSIPNCVASRTTLTVAPTGQWRSRSQPLDKTTGEALGKAVLAQGCWEPIGTKPWRIVLRSTDNATTATLTFTNDNVLRVDTYNDIKPTLDYRLTRQQDIDGIHELDGASGSSASGNSNPVGSTPINCQNRDERP